MSAADSTGSSATGRGRSGGIAIWEKSQKKKTQQNAKRKALLSSKNVSKRGGEKNFRRGIMERAGETEKQLNGVGEQTGERARGEGMHWPKNE